MYIYGPYIRDIEIENKIVQFAHHCTLVDWLCSYSDSDCDNALIVDFNVASDANLDFLRKTALLHVDPLTKYSSQWFKQDMLKVTTLEKSISTILFLFCHVVKYNNSKN